MAEKNITNAYIFANISALISKKTEIGLFIQDTSQFSFSLRGTVRF